MGWFNKNSFRSPQRLTPRVVKFIGEQDGPAERDLKGSFVKLFRVQPKVERAYLARVEHGDRSGIHVTLCLKCFPAEEVPPLVPKVADIFGKMFGSHEHLDIRFLREDEERELRSVCTPFYSCKPLS